MSPLREFNRETDSRFPRVSGDEPGPLTDALSSLAFSPRERG